MKEEKFKSEIETLEKFFTIYCKDKHKDQFEKSYTIPYKNITLKPTLNLCQECHELFEYAIHRLQECPHEEKPRCRKCPTPCYEKEQWKKMAKMMRYSGMKLGLTKLAKKLNLLKN